MNEHDLTKWRRLLILRDKDFCVMCHRQTKVWQLQAHHVYPKSLYPELALNLDNGVMLCVGCHMGVVHAGNSTVDIASLNHWKFFVPSFKQYLNTYENFLFTRNNQDRLPNDSTGKTETKSEDGDSDVLRTDLSDS